jgi:nucleotide-binding universal stress UspA family protein
MYKKILCPIDGSKVARRGLREALRLASRTEAELVILHVIDSTDFLIYPPQGSPVYDYMQDQGRDILKKALKSAQKEYAHVESKLTEVRKGRVAQEIVAVARKLHADLIVMGTTGRRGLAGVVLGSDAAAVVASSPVPVLLVK